MNKTIQIPLRIKCPPGCVCKSSAIRNQTHSSCQTQQYINEKGNVVCQNYLNGKGCQPIFIKNITFQCDEAKKKNYKYQFKNSADFLMAFAQSLQASQLNLLDQELKQLTTNLTSSVCSRWYD